MVGWWHMGCSDVGMLGGGTSSHSGYLKRRPSRPMSLLGDSGVISSPSVSVPPREGVCLLGGAGGAAGGPVSRRLEARAERAEARGGAPMATRERADAGRSLMRADICPLTPPRVDAGAGADRRRACGCAEGRVAKAPPPRTAPPICPSPPPPTAPPHRARGAEARGVAPLAAVVAAAGRKGGRLGAGAAEAPPQPPEPPPPPQ